LDKDNGQNGDVVNVAKCMCVCAYCKKESVSDLAIIFDFIQQEIKWSCPDCGEQNVFRGWSEFRSTPFPRIRTQR
jgi:transposase-like protein